MLIRLDGTIGKRKKKLSKEIYGTSHKISFDEAEYIYEEGAEKLLIGTGQYNQVTLSDEARNFFNEHQITVILEAIPRAAELWNTAEGNVIGLFHVTC